MAVKKNNKEYKPLAETISIAATSRCSVKVQDNFYTVEYHEERKIPEGIAVDIVKEREALWDTVNNECDNQVQEILRTFKK